MSTWKARETVVCARSEKKTRRYDWDDNAPEDSRDANSKWTGIGNDVFEAGVSRRYMITVGGVQVIYRCTSTGTLMNRKTQLPEKERLARIRRWFAVVRV
ncbi:hypothetical protein SERLA73DRAFT_191497 [Serpula lacrymans var. lacrymans S7.3]|uniref:Uncharacterized protein n=1 Tax=Serpula lacrymans var. lacrymans (strain S7.3) TaxID=936435 RepID=F8QHQ1_SERL3|nr:hypothetical protein SERLA73DRAFT_191497 [Serpula lacrymans var. lacrymans S7.3]